MQNPTLRRFDHFFDHLYIPMRKGFLYLVAIMDWFTRKVLAWRISNMLEADFCVEALNEAVHKFGTPEIMNTDSHMRGLMPEGAGSYHKGFNGVSATCTRR